MGFYNGTAMELLCQQVIRDNPSMAGRLTPDAVTVNGTAVARSVNGRNTQITFVGIPGKGLLGELTLSYDRINLLNFTGNLYFPVQMSDGVTTYTEALPDINDQLGLNLTRADLAAPDTVLTGGTVGFTSIDIAIAAGSALYNGTLRVNWRRTPVGNYTGTGPGPTMLLAGDEQSGYFGVVPAAEMFTAQELVNAILEGTGLSANVGTASYDWMKFFYKGKVLFIPKRPLVGTSWDNYYKAGSAYGSDDPNGPLYPGSDGVAVQQNKIIAKRSGDKSYYFHHRLPRGAENIIGSSSLAGEDYGLVRKILGGEWGNEPGTTIGQAGVYYMSQHIGNASQPQLFSIYTMKGEYFNSQISKTQTYGYVPVLEYVNPDDTVLPVSDFSGKYNITVTPPVVTYTPQVNELSPIVPLATRTTLLTSPATSVSADDGLMPLTPLAAATPKLTPATVTASTRVPNAKTSLNTTNGVLGDFK
jgi:hypothetical protein